LVPRPGGSQQRDHKPRELWPLAATTWTAQMDDAWYIEASIGGWPGPAYSVRGADATVTYQHLARYGEGEADQVTLEVTEEELAEFWEAVDAGGVWDWAAKYVDDKVLDGTHWAITLERSGRRVESQGSNAYPHATSSSGWRRTWGVEALLSNAFGGGGRGGVPMGCGLSSAALARPNLPGRTTGAAIPVLPPHCRRSAPTRTQVILPLVQQAAPAP
jgi:hypothetical protein